MVLCCVKFCFQAEVSMKKTLDFSKLQTFFFLWILFLISTKLVIFILKTVGLILFEITKQTLSLITEVRLDFRSFCNCPSWSNSLWQGCICGLVHCPGGNATDPIWRVLASSLGISSWTPLKPQHSNPNRLANQLWCIDFLTPPTPLIIPHRLPAFLESIMPLKNWCSIPARWSESSLKHTFLWHVFQV